MTSLSHRLNHDITIINKELCQYAFNDNVCTLHYTILHCATVLHSTLHNTLHYTTLHYMHCIALHCTTRLQAQTIEHTHAHAYTCTQMGALVHSKEVVAYAETVLPGTTHTTHRNCTHKNTKTQKHKNTITREQKKYKPHKLLTNTHIHQRLHW